MPEPTVALEKHSFELAITSGRVQFDTDLNFEVHQFLPYAAPEQYDNNGNLRYYSFPIITDANYVNNKIVCDTFVPENNAISFVNGYNEVETGSVGAIKNVAVSMKNQVYSFYIPKPFSINVLTAITLDYDSNNNVIGIANKTIEQATFEPWLMIKYRTNSRNQYSWYWDSSSCSPIYDTLPSACTDGNLGFHNIDSLVLGTGSFIKTQSDYHAEATLGNYIQSAYRTYVPVNCAISTFPSSSRYDSITAPTHSTSAHCYTMRANKLCYSDDSRYTTPDQKDYYYKMLFGLVPSAVSITAFEMRF